MWDPDAATEAQNDVINHVTFTQLLQRPSSALRVTYGHHVHCRRQYNTVRLIFPRDDGIPVESVG